MGKAVISGLFTRGKPFLRTPKCEDQALLRQALRKVWQETTLFGLCLLALLSLATGGSFDDPSDPALDGDDRACRACPISRRSSRRRSARCRTSRCAPAGARAGAASRSRRCPRPLRRDDFPRIEDVVGIERALQRAHEVDLDGALVARSWSRFCTPMPCSALIEPPNSCTMSCTMRWISSQRARKAALSSLLWAR